MKEDTEDTCAKEQKNTAKEQKKDENADKEQKKGIYGTPAAGWINHTQSISSFFVDKLYYQQAFIPVSFLTSKHLYQ